jgi:MoxR-like ATPase
MGKTLLVRTLGIVLGCESKRIQFTPDLMPSDVTGGNVFDQRRGAFEFLKGPVFTQLLLGDEINRAPPKTQSALLEAMQERSVTVDGATRPLPEPFLVIATQNPIESQGTYPLPEAQLDRFLFKLDVRAPTQEAEKAILANHLAGFDASALDRAGLRRITSVPELLEMQAAVRTVRVDDSLLDYIAEIVGRTRGHRSLYFGASPRGSVALLAAAQARAAGSGRDFAIPDDVKALAPAVLRHRVGLQPDAEIEGVSAEDCITEILRNVRVPNTAAA